jgi:hypothetical protein
MHKTPFVVGGLLFLLVLFFFVASPERFLYPSRASQERVRLFFTPNELSARSGELIPVSLYLQTNPGVPVSEARIGLQYDPEVLAVDSTGDGGAHQSCEANSFFMNSQREYHNDITTGMVSLTRFTSQEGRDGLFCWGTVYFRALRSGVTEVSLPTGLEGSFFISGSHGELLPMLEEREVITVTISN